MRLKIGGKIIASFAIIIGVMLVLATVVVRNLGQMDHASHWNDHTYKVLLAADQTLAAVVDQETGVRGFLIAGEDKFLDPYRGGQKAFASGHAELKKLTSDNPAQQRRLDEINGLAGKWRSDVAEVEIALMRNAATREQARAMEAAGAGKASIDGIRKLFDEFNSAEKSLLGVRTEALQSASSTARMAMFAGSLIAALAAVILGWLLSSSIARPVAQMTQAMNRLAEGDHQIDIPAVGRQDEIGQMAVAVAVFKTAAIDKVRLEKESAEARNFAERERATADEQRAALAREQADVVQRLGDGLAALAQRDLTHRLDAFPADYKKLEADFNAAVDALRETMSLVTNNSEMILSGSGEVSSAADDLSKRTEQQAASLEQTAAAIDEITATGRKAAEGAEHAREVVSNAKKDAETTGVVVRKTVEAMGGIEKSAQQISQIIGVIDEIAFQTNLLALNAGVEAARAGDAGRGFAVVASEVRALAQRSAEAAKEIKGLISTSSSQVAEGVSLVAETGKALERILLQVNDINKVVTDIAAGAKEQATGLSEVNTAINQMDQATQQNAAMVEQSTAASHSLRQEANQLAELIGQFRIGHTAGHAARAPSARVAASKPQLKAVATRGSGSVQRTASGRHTTSAKRKPEAEEVEKDWQDF